MTKSEIIQQLKTFISLKSTQLTLKHKLTQLQNAVKPRKEPDPDDYRPSKNGILIETFKATFLCIIILIFVLSAADVLDLSSGPVMVAMVEKVLGNYYFAIAVCVIGLMIVLSFTTFFISSFITSFRYRKQQREGVDRLLTAAVEYQEWKRLLPEWESQLEKVRTEERVYETRIQRLAIIDYIHPNYLNNYAHVLLEYLEYGRADTVKEAVNLLELELRQMQREQEENRYRKEMLRQAQMQTEASQEAAEQSRRAAKTANEAAFWGAAATFLIATDRRNND